MGYRSISDGKIDSIVIFDESTQYATIDNNLQNH